MDHTKLRLIKNPKALARLEARYATQLEELRRLGFQDLGAHYDYAPPYFFFGSFVQLFLMFLVREEWCFAWPFTHALLCPLYFHAETATYARIFGLGTMFFNSLPDGSLYITASWAGDERRNEEAKLYKRYGSPVSCGILGDLHAEAQKPSSQAGLWQRHLGWIGETHPVLVKEGYVPSLEDFERISAVESVGLSGEV